MKIPIKDFSKKAKLVKSDDRYFVYDLEMEDLVVSMTILHPKKETRGHSHEDAEEVYFFLEGNGEIQVGEERFKVKKGDLITIPRGNFHKVFNTGNKELIFLSVFEKYEGRGK